MTTIITAHHPRVYRRFLRRYYFSYEMSVTLDYILAQFMVSSQHFPTSHQVCKHPLCSTPNIDKLPDPTTSPCLSPPATTDLAYSPVQSTTLSPRRSAATSSIFPKG